MVKGDVALRIPSNVSFEEAATMGCGIGTVALGLYKHLSLPLPPVTPDDKNPKDFLLVYGGSSATGTLAIQFAKL
jgi:NADPH:quinone reductase-like Zn-dependent oxidoreductase